MSYSWERDTGAMKMPPIMGIFFWAIRLSMAAMSWVCTTAVGAAVVIDHEGKRHAVLIAGGDVDPAVAAMSARTAASPSTFDSDGVCACELECGDRAVRHIRRNLNRLYVSPRGLGRDFEIAILVQRRGEIDGLGVGQGFERACWLRRRFSLRL